MSNPSNPPVLPSSGPLSAVVAAVRRAALSAASNPPPPVVATLPSTASRIGPHALPYGMDISK